MIVEGNRIEKYMRDVIRPDYGEVFILMERKCESKNEDQLIYNYHCKGNDLDMLMSLAVIIERISKQMGLSFEATIDVLKNVHLQENTVKRAREEKRISKEWTVLE